MGTHLAIVEQVVAKGDLAQLTPAERVSYYTATCESLGLNPLTKPFDYLQLNGKLVLYPNRTCGDQLREQRKVSVTIAARETIRDVYVVTARATTPDGRTDESTGAVDTKSLVGERLANAMMKAETKAKRRVTLSICGLGWPDESEVESIEGAKRVQVTADGEVLPPPAQEKPAEPQMATDKDLENVLAAHAECTTLAELEQVSRANKNRKWTKEQIKVLRADYAKREKELQQPANADDDGREPVSTEAAQ